MESTKKIELKLHSVLIGIRFERSWRILDISGSVIDKILADKKSPFNRATDYFNRIGDEKRGRIAINPETDCHLRINIDDLIFKHVIDSFPEDSDKDLNWFFKSLKDFLIPKIIVGFKIKQIKRVGIIYYHQVDAKEIDTKFMCDIVEDDSAEVTKFNLDFHKKYPAELSIAKKDINDYKNVIYSIKHKESQEDKGEKKYEISLDYQYYFEPNNDNIEDWNIENFLGASESYLKKHFYPWLTKKIDNIEVKNS